VKKWSSAENMLLHIHKKLHSLILRKIIHLMLVTLLFLPFVVDIRIFGLTTLTYYSILLLVSAFINSIQVKKPPLVKIVLEHIEETRNKFFAKISSIESKSEINAFIVSFLSEIEHTLIPQINAAIRDYERLGGYIGITFGAIGVLVSNILFKNYVFYGALALAVVDTVTALVGKFLGKTRIPGTNATLEGSLAGLVAFFVTLSLIKVNAIAALIISTLTVIAEAYGVEDNLAIPLTASFTAYLLKAPIPSFPS